MNDFTTSFVVDQSPEKVFEAINNVRGWWGEDVEGSHANVGDEFTYRVQDVHYSKLRVIERIPNEKVDQTEVRFAHLGLLPQFECFGVCSNAWGSLMGSSLPSLIATGTGHPYK